MLGTEPHQASQKWAQMYHPSLQRCYLQMIDATTKATCYILEYPLMSLKDVIVSLSGTQTFLSEYILWDLMLQISLVVKHLEKHGMSNNLYEPCNFIITQEGRVKVENFLLYLPAKGRVCPRFPGNSNRAIYFSPEQVAQSRGTTVWNLACIFYELASLAPAFYSPRVFQQRARHGKIHWMMPPPDRLSNQYSSELRKLIMKCFTIPSERPTFQCFINAATRRLKELRVNYTGPRNILKFLSGISQAENKA